MCLSFSAARSYGPPPPPGRGAVVVGPWSTRRYPCVAEEPWERRASARAMKELDDGKGQRFDTAEQLFRDLDI